MLQSHALTPCILCRFHSSAKAVKLSKSGVTPAKGSLTSGKLSPPRIDTPAEPQPEVDLVFLMDIIHAYTYIDICAYIHHPLQSSAFWNLWPSLTAKSTLCFVLFYFSINVFYNRISQPNCIQLCECSELFLLKKLGRGSWHTTYLGLFLAISYSSTIFSIYDYFCLWE